MNQLTRREKDVVDQVMIGNTSSREIARALGIKPSTVEVHLFHIKKKTGANKKALPGWAWRNGWGEKQWMN